MRQQRERAASPAMSEVDIDIGASLFTDDVDQAKPSRTTNSDGFGFDADGIFNEADGSSDDEAFIALQQAASFRKGANVQGKSVKKGGGFQAMGAFRLHRFPLFASSSLRCP